LGLQIHCIQTWDEGKKVSDEEQEAANQTQSLDDIVAICNNAM
jgi:hypothetical protein